MAVAREDYRGLLKDKYSEFEIAVYKLAKKYEISMTRSSEQLVEFFEEDYKKAHMFRSEVKKLNPATKCVELIYANQYTDTKGFDIRKSKAMYLVDDDYYNALIGNVSEQESNVYEDNEQVSLFSTVG